MTARAKTVDEMTRQETLLKVAEKTQFEPDGCWTWLGSINGYGYARMSNGAGRTYINVPRLMRSMFYGDLTSDLVVDHLCHDPAQCTAGIKCPHRRCINPAHLEPVTVGVNTKRGGSFSSINTAKTHCPYGHAYTADNLVQSKTGNRKCKTCHRDNARAARYSRREG